MSKTSKNGKETERGIEIGSAAAVANPETILSGSLKAGIVTFTSGTKRIPVQFYGHRLRFLLYCFLLALLVTILPDHYMAAISAKVSRVSSTYKARGSAAFNSLPKLPESEPWVGRQRDEHIQHHRR